MQQIIFKEDGTFLNIFIPQRLYSKEAILNFLYWKLHESSVHFSVFSDKEFQVSIELSAFSIAQIDEFKKTLSNELIDYELREIVQNQTKNVRELIIAKAFANGTLDDLDS